jgi:hypothetical protein
MKYEKPEIVPLADALAAVQMIAKENQPHDLADPSETTVSAYEADE